MKSFMIDESVISNKCVRSQKYPSRNSKYPIMNTNERETTFFKRRATIKPVIRYLNAIFRMRQRYLWRKKSLEPIGGCFNRIEF
jgi:hypothetical protein